MDTKFEAMKTLFSILIFGVCFGLSAQDPTIAYLIDQVNPENLNLTLREFSGEDSTTVDGQRVLIRNRVSNSGNDLAADYIAERLEAMGLTAINQVYSEKGRNVYAVQTGQTNPDDIFLICGHYDAVADYCADDNASAVAAILETARILSDQCLNYTIVYAFWDEEEIGLKGSRFYANTTSDNGDNILGVLNIDMMAYDGDDDRAYDIDLNGDEDSEAMRDLLLAVNEDYDLDLVPNVIQPGTFASDHASFWSRGYGGVLLGEAWSEDDESPFYHSSEDRYSTLNLPYFHEMVRLALGYMATAASPVDVETGLSMDDVSLTANLADANYQWYSCSNGYAAIEGATSATFVPTDNGNYSVLIEEDECAGMSTCTAFEVLISEIVNELKGVAIYPNPVRNELKVKLEQDVREAYIHLLSVDGKTAEQWHQESSTLTMNLSAYPPGWYILNIRTSEGEGYFRVIHH